MVRPVADPMESMGRAMSLAQLAQTGQLNRMKLDQAQREDQERTSLADLYRGLYTPDGKEDRAGFTQRVAQAGLGQHLPAIRKGWAEADAKQAELEKTRTETQGLNYAQLQKRVEAANGALTSLLARPTVTHQDVLGAMQGLVQQGLAKPEEMAAAAQQIPTDPAALRPWLQQKHMEGLSAAERLKALMPNWQGYNNGKTTEFRDLNGITNPNGPAPVQMTTTPDADLSANVQRQRLAQEDRHFQTRQQSEGQGVTYQQDANGNLVALPTKAAPGTMVRAVPVAAPGAGLQPLQGKPSEAVQKEQLSINQQIALVDSAIKQVRSTPSAFSFKRGVATMAGPVPESLAGRLDSDEEVQARAFLFNNVSAVINERAGAAQSAQELARLRAFLPAETDSGAQIVSKLMGYRSYLTKKASGTTTSRDLAPPPPDAPNKPAGARPPLSAFQR
jgi:hypothetical protein